MQEHLALTPSRLLRHHPVRAKEIQRDFTKFVTCTMKKALDPDETKMEMDESHVLLVSNSSY